MSALQLSMYFGVVFFAIVVFVKMLKIAKMPQHLRWDLYPIPHEKGKGHYGGSYFEETDWWKKPSNVSRISELITMAKEIIFVHSVYENNKPMWLFSFPFHLGMYCLIGLELLLILGAILGVVGIEIAATSTSLVGVAVHHLTIYLGAVGWVLAIVGAFGLLMHRIFSTELRRTSVLSDYTNLLILLVMFISSLVAWWTVDPNYSLLRSFVADMFTFQSAGIMPTAVIVELWLMFALLLYFPFTHMTHLFAKYFTYHSVRWADEPNLPGSEIEDNVKEVLGYELTWAAPHIKSGGTWAEAATATEEDNKDE